MLSLSVAVARAPARSGLRVAAPGERRCPPNVATELRLAYSTDEFQLAFRNLHLDGSGALTARDDATQSAKRDRCGVSGFWRRKRAESWRATLRKPVLPGTSVAGQSR